MGKSIPNIGESALGDPIGKAVVEIIADDKEYRKGLKRSETALRSFDKEQAKIIQSGAKGFAVLGGTIAGIGVIATTSFLTAAVANERMMKGLEAVAGGAEEANRQLEDLRVTAMLPGLGLPEAVQASINLQAVGIEAEKSNVFIREMGNALASVGRGRQDLEGVIRGMQQMTSRGKVLAEEINQISERVPQFRAAMQAAFGTATSEDIQKLGITVEEFLDKTVAELAKLPRVSGGASNAIENLSDSWREFRVETGKFLLPALTKTVDKLSDMVGVLNDLSDAQKKLVGFGAVGAAGLGSIVASLGVLTLAAPGIKATGKAMAFLTGKLMQLGAVGVGGLTIGGIVAGIGAGLATFAAGLKLGTDQIDDTREALTGFDAVTKAQRNNIAKIQTGIEEWQAKLDALEKGLADGVTNLQRFDQATQKWIDTPIGKQIELVEGKITGLSKALRIAKGDIYAAVEPLKAATAETEGFSTAAKLIFNPLQAFVDLMADLASNATITKSELIGVANITDELRAALSADSRDIGIFKNLTSAVNQYGRTIGRVKALTDRLIKTGDLPDPTDFSDLEDAELDRQRRLSNLIKKLNTTAGIDVIPLTGGLTERDQNLADSWAAANREKMKITEDEIAFERETARLLAEIKTEDDAAEKRKLRKDLNDLRTNRRARVKAEQKALDDIVTAQEQAAADVLRAWERTKDEIQDAFVGLFDGIIREGKADWQAFLDDLGRMFSRKFAEIAADRTVGALLDKLAGGRTGGGTTGAVREAAAGQATSSFLGRLFGTGPAPATQLPGGGTLGAKIFGVEPAVATAAAATPAAGGGTLAAAGIPTVAAIAAPFALPLIGLIAERRQEEQRELEQREAFRDRLQDFTFSVGEMTAFLNRQRKIQNKDFEDFEPGRRSGERGIIQRAGDSNSVNIDNLVIQMPDNINDMSRAELDRSTSRQIASTARAFKRDPRTRRSLR